MKKKFSKFLLLIILTIAMTTSLNVKAATSKTVNSEAELKEALKRKRNRGWNGKNVFRKPYWR